MPLDPVREWALWFGPLLGVNADLPPGPDEIETPTIPPEIARLKREMVDHRKGLEEAAGGGPKRLKKLQDLASTADAAIDTADVPKAQKAVDALKKEMDLRPPAFGERSGKTDGELVEAWNSKTEAYEFHHPDEWKRLVERGGGGEMVGGSTEMINLRKSKAKYVYDRAEKKLKVVEGEQAQTGVFIQGHDNQFIGTYETHIRWERESTQQMRQGMSANVNQREGQAKDGVAKNCAMAQKLTGLIKSNPALLEDGGLLGRIAGKISGQGQHDVDAKNIDAKAIEQVIQDISQASDRLQQGKGQEGDANKIMQLIGCFTDGLTEVAEFRKGDKKKEKAALQFDAVWPAFKEAFNLEDGDKEKLLARVDGYKEIAGGVADTISGKGTRKDVTRGQLKDQEGKPIPAAMPNDPRYKISDENALIKNDISGSMHSSLLASELAENLVGGTPIKGKGESVLVKDKGLLDARAYDALSLTAGGQAGEKDIVMHTAYEMINGMRAITGGPEVDEAGASFIIRQMSKGLGFTDSMESLFKPEQLPWLAGAGAGIKQDTGPTAKLQKQLAACEYRLSKEMDGSKYRPTDILDLVSYTTSEIREFEKGIDKAPAGPAKIKLQSQLDGVKDLLNTFVLSAMQRAADTLEQQKATTFETAGHITQALTRAPDAKARKDLYLSANKALVKLDGQINDWQAQFVEGNGLPGIDALAGPLAEMIEAQRSLEQSMKSLLPTLKGQPVKDDGSQVTPAPQRLVIHNDEDAERVLIECKDWSEAKKLYAQYKTEMQKLANFRQKVVDAWLDANLRDRYGLMKGADLGWVSVGSQDPTSDYDISINKHSLDKDGNIQKYDYELVAEFNDHFRRKYGCETGTIFDTNLYASAPGLQLLPREDESPEEKEARQNIAASNDIGALMKQRRYMSGPEFNDYMVSVLQGIPEEQQFAVASRFRQADDNYRVALQKTIEVLVKQVAKNVKKLDEAGGSKEEIDELNKLLEREQAIRAGSNADIIGGTDEMEHLAHDLEHACKDTNTQSTNDLYLEATQGRRAVESKIIGLQACIKSAEGLQKAAKALAELPQSAPESEREKLVKTVDELKSALSKAVADLNDTRLKDVPKAIEEGRWDAATSALARLAPELYEELGRAFSLSMFFANEAYQSGGPFKHVVYAGQAVEGDVRSGVAKGDNDQQALETDKKKQLDALLLEIKAKLEINMTATEQPGADQTALQTERDELTRQFGTLTDEVVVQDKKIKELEGKIQIAIATERKKRRAELSSSECLDTFNEQLGDFLKDLAHYGDAEPGVAIIQSSKYLDRLLDAVALISDRGLVKDDGLAQEVQLQVARMKDVQDQLIKARKGQIKMVPVEGGEPFTPEEELEQRRALACKIMSDWGINSVASLHRVYADLGKRVNIEVRKNMAVGT